MIGAVVAGSAVVVVADSAVVVVGVQFVFDSVVEVGFLVVKGSFGSSIVAW